MIYFKNSGQTSEPNEDSCPHGAFILAEIGNQPNKQNNSYNKQVKYVVLSTLETRNIGQGDQVAGIGWFAI